MNYLEIVLIAAGLSMDAFAVSITLGLSVKKPSIKEYLLPGLYFGFFQALMPLTGYFAGTLFAEKIQSAGHWVAFILLTIIGGKMAFESFSKEEGGDESNANKFLFVNMLMLAVATSIDALAVGVTFALFQINIYAAIAIIGLTTCLISIGGVKIGNIFGMKFKSKAELLGGAVLVGLGIKILIEHTLFKGAV
ncbi:MAG: manganese efflux pump MntP family protein [Chitinispirillia bacterium]|nr:manganese efflux pump MntP family protein [Chitinispirillia bacterium]MCL2242005.1 manganese efflux pump MntP family protein [Chitinispirillia bacterium]